MRKDLIWDSYYGAGDSLKIAAFEKLTGYSLPESYKKIVSQYNGAFVDDKDAFKLFSNLINEEVVFGSGLFLPYGVIEDVTETIELEWKDKPDGFPANGLLIFSALGNGDQLCFDYRNTPTTKNPPVVVWHHEGSTLEESISPVANNFDGFLDLLFEEKD